MPGLLGGLTAALISLTSYGANKSVMPAGHHQALYQIFGMLVTLGMAIGGGFVAATAVKTVTPQVHQLQTEHLFDDGMWWEEVEEEETASASHL